MTEICSVKNPRMSAKNKTSQLYVNQRDKKIKYRTLE